MLLRRHLDKCGLPFDHLGGRLAQEKGSCDLRALLAPQNDQLETREQLDSNPGLQAAPAEIEGGNPGPAKTRQERACHRQAGILFRLGPQADRADTRWVRRGKRVNQACWIEELAD